MPECSRKGGFSRLWLKRKRNTQMRKDFYEIKVESGVEYINQFFVVEKKIEV